ncbi:U3 small nucleolar RNA-associated protein 6 [Plasmodium gonderi]|uniref:U3 small nucleolar RNA-associated protein 6 n=1 Tax=Plasmodium gonderi TaxID=77519 RepID=A0A1Y1JL70_PLAGO|nr:U3 small nucleolar RNA-associated protein 6 [Plasmodium gonderi]GAW83279.1 U3 small nucleolar RNA-associated protein 6 [Plasmodium gonderi]
MIDKVCRLVENMVYELNDLKRKELFTDKEIRIIANKRRNHEYTINSSTCILLNFILYIEFEINLENLREKRKSEKKNNLLNEINEYKKLLKNHYSEFTKLKEEMKNENCPKKCKALKKLLNKNENHIKCYKNNILKIEKKLEILLRYSLSDTSLVKRIIQIFQTCLRKHHNNVEVWLQYFNFCYMKQKKEELENAILNCLKYHIKNELIWIFYLYYFYNIRKNIHYTRKLYIRAILFVPKSLCLNILYFNIEFDIFYKLLTNVKQKVDNSNEHFDKFSNFCKNDKKEQETKNDISIIHTDQTDDDILKLNIDQNSQSERDNTIIEDDDKYGLDAIIFLGNKFIKTYQNDKNSLHIFIFSLLNIYLKMEKSEWIKNYVLQFDNFKKLIFNSIQTYKFDQPCFYYYLFVTKCVTFSHFDFSEDKDFLLLKNSYYYQNDQEEQILQKYFNLEEVNNLLHELFSSFHNDLMIYFFCILLINLFDMFIEYNNIGDVFTIQNYEQTELSHSVEYEDSLFKDSQNGINESDVPTKINIHRGDQYKSTDGDKKNILFYMHKPTLTSHEDLQIFQFLKDEIFLCDTYKFRKINEEYLKERDKSTHHFLQKLNFMAYVCLFENRHSTISKNNFIYDFEQTNKNSDILSSILYFFLFDKRNIEKDDQVKKKHHFVQPDQVNILENGLSKKRKRDNPSLSGKNRHIARTFRDPIKKEEQRDTKKNMYESDSDNMSLRESAKDESSAYESETDAESGSSRSEVTRVDIRDDACDDARRPKEQSKMGSNLKQDLNSQASHFPNVEKTCNEKIFIIDNLVLLLRKDIDTFVKITILQCVLKLIIYINNNKIKRHFRSTISEEYSKVRESSQKKNFVKTELNNLAYLHNKVYTDDSVTE